VLYAIVGASVLELAPMVKGTDGHSAFAAYYFGRSIWPGDCRFVQQTTIRHPRLRFLASSDNLALAVLGIGALFISAFLTEFFLLLVLQQRNSRRTDGPLQPSHRSAYFRPGLL